jgi:hypothetical protein
VLALAQHRARALVFKHRDAIERVANALLEFGTLDGAAIDRLCGQAVTTVDGLTLACGGPSAISDHAALLANLTVR